MTKFKDLPLEEQQRRREMNRAKGRLGGLIGGKATGNKGLRTQSLEDRRRISAMGVAARRAKREHNKEES